MSVPNLSSALRGWVKRRTVTIVTKQIVDHETQETETTTILPINIQPMPAQEVDRKPEGERAWKWWSIIIRSATMYLSEDDKVTVNNTTYRIQKAHDWRESGFTKYEAVEDYQ